VYRCIVDAYRFVPCIHANIYRQGKGFFISFNGFDVCLPVVLYQLAVKKGASSELIKLTRCSTFSEISAFAISSLSMRVDRLKNLLNLKSLCFFNSSSIREEGACIGN
jgi:hypothetical protein